MRWLPLALALPLSACSDPGADQPPQPEPAGEGICGRVAPTTWQGTECNGSPDLCDLRFDQVVFPMTHNSASSDEYGFAAAFANQHRGIASQLSDGVRGFMLDTYYYDGERVQAEARIDGLPIEEQVYFCHSTCALGHRQAIQAFCELVRFLDSHPGEIVSIIFES